MKLQGRRFCLTLNNWTESEYSKIHDYLTTKTFWIIGKEIGSENNTPHLQIYFEHKTPIAFKTIKNICNRVHIEKAKGNLKQNYDYCSKEGNFETNITESDLEKKIKTNTNITETELSTHFAHHWNNDKIKEHLDLIDFFIDNFDRIFLEWTIEKIKSKINSMLTFLKDLKDCQLCKTHTIEINYHSLLRLKENFLS